jgi:arylsulfatase A-like enzyme
MLNDLVERRKFLKLLFASGLALSGASAVPAFLSGCRGRTKRPNVILISIDTLRADHLGCYGYAKDTTPSLDNFAGEGVQFQRVICPFPSTLPSHMSMLTSLYPEVHGVIPKDMLKLMIPEKDWKYNPFGISLTGSVEVSASLDPAWPTLAELMAEAGYRTAGFVRSCVWMDAKYGFDQGFQLYSVTDENAEQLNRRVFSWLANQGDAPFFLFVHYYDVHSDWDRLPYDSPAPYDQMFLPANRGAFNGCGGGKCASQYLLELNNHGTLLAKEEREYIEGMYDGGVRYTDHHVGEFLQEVERRGLGEDTMVVITADHGEEFQEHGRLLHSQIYDEVMAVPLLMRYPGNIRPHSKVSGTVESIDIMPTILDLAGIRRGEPSMLQGKSLVPLLSGDGGGGAKEAYCSGPLSNALIQGTWKLIYNPHNEAAELYDLAEDPGERHNLGSTSEDRVQSMAAAIRDRMRKNAELRKKVARGNRKSLPLKQEEVEKLKSLGYVR